MITLKNLNFKWWLTFSTILNFHQVNIGSTLAQYPDCVWLFNNCCLWVTKSWAWVNYTNILKWSQKVSIRDMVLALHRADTTSIYSTMCDRSPSATRTCSWLQSLGWYLIPLGVTSKQSPQYFKLLCLVTFIINLFV